MRISFICFSVITKKDVCSSIFCLRENQISQIFLPLTFHSYILLFPNWTTLPSWMSHVYKSFFAKHILKKIYRISKIFKVACLWKCYAQCAQHGKSVVPVGRIAQKQIWDNLSFPLFQNFYCFCALTYYFFFFQAEDRKTDVIFHMWLIENNKSTKFSLIF